jgi:small Trp-rich protein
MEYIMYLVWLGAMLVLCKWFEILFFKNLSWWWVIAPLVLAFIYFEVLEPMFGWDKKQAYDKADEYKRKRIQQQLKNQSSTKK